jgi:hypothetical protein
MDTNHLPAVDWNKILPGCCCPEFDPATWDGQELHFRDKLFVRCKTISCFYFPLNMGSVFTRTWNAIKAAGADEDEFAVLSEDISRWRGEHYINIKHEVPGADNVRLTGDYLARVFEGPYSDTPKWVHEMEKTLSERDRKLTRLFFYYTSCPKCAKARGKNYVVGIAQV